MTDASRYLLLDRLAIGGMAEVYRAKALGIAGFEKIVAIKRVRPNLADDAEFVEMFVDEAKIAGQLHHANIAAILELGKIDRIHFIAMEYVFGRNVRQILDAIREGRVQLPPSLAAWIIGEVLAGLDYAHRKRDESGRPLGIVHRDVSPPNVIVSYDGLVKLVDFGIAKAAMRATQTVAGVIKGKLSYMSPEQLMGQPLDHRSDVFAAAALLHELLTGKRLFDGDNDFEVTERVRTAAAEPPSHLAPDVTPALDAVVMRGLARDPGDRWSTAGEMQDALVEAVAGPGVPFGTPALREWMRESFREEHAKQSAKLRQLLAVDAPGVPLEAPAEEEGPDEEATVLTAPPSMSEGLGEESSVIELSSLVVIEQSRAAIDVSEPSLAVDVDVVALEPSVSARPVVRVSDPPTSPTDHVTPAPAGAAKEAVSPPTPAPRPTSGAPEPTTSLGPPSSAPSPAPARPIPESAVAPPRLSAETLRPRDRSAPARRRTRAGLWVALVILAIAFGLAAAAGIWLHITGRLPS